MDSATVDRCACFCFTHVTWSGIRRRAHLDHGSHHGVCMGAGHDRRVGLQLGQPPSTGHRGGHVLAGGRTLVHLASAPCATAGHHARWLAQCVRSAGTAGPVAAISLAPCPALPHARGSSEQSELATLPNRSGKTNLERRSSPGGKQYATSGAFPCGRLIGGPLPLAGESDVRAAHGVDRRGHRAGHECMAVPVAHGPHAGPSLAPAHP